MADVELVKDLIREVCNIDQDYPSLSKDANSCLEAYREKRNKRGNPAHIWAGLMVVNLLDKGDEEAANKWSELSTRIIKSMMESHDMRAGRELACSVCGFTIYTTVNGTDDLNCMRAHVILEHTYA